MMRIHRHLLTAAVAASMLLGGEALAQNDDAGGGDENVAKSEGRRPAGVITLDEITITGRIQKPIAAVDVARIRPKLTLSELRQPFLDRISNSIYEEPF